MQSDLFELVKCKTSPRGFGLSHNGKYMAVMGKDRILRVFYFATGKVIWRIDESIKTI